MKKAILVVLLLSACSSSGDDGWYDRQVQEAAALHITRHGAAQAKPNVQLGWGEVFTGSRGNENCVNVIRSLGRWPGDTVCRQNDLPGVGQVLYILTTDQKNRMKSYNCGERSWFEYKPGATGTMPVYEARYGGRHWRYRNVC